MAPGRHTKTGIFSLPLKAYIMHRKLPLLILFVTLLIVVSCKKSNSSSTSNPLVGNWNFLYIKANTSGTLTVSGTTTVILANYTTQNNAGTAQFTNDSMALKGLAYSVNTTATVNTYAGSNLINTTTQPYSTSLPPLSETVAYQVIGSDSIYFPAGGPVPGTGSGGRFAIKQDTLSIVVNGTQPIAGGVLETVNATIYFLKQ
jgi:hypothetical protein